ncbi:transposase family protein [Micromonospora sp. KC207]|uniref:transposase family protein n=1 Tax=Micromonospora sp. KC207 TaxID=2530377 RepID=UPI001FB81A7E|nr:transposase family protein [Micromonospora sp. KC207]
MIAVPWARHGARFTTALEDTAARLAARTSASAVTGLLRVAWRSLVATVGRVVDAAAAGTDRLAGLRRIGVDEVASPLGGPRGSDGIQHGPIQFLDHSPRGHRNLADALRFTAKVPFP